jgi:two-component system sensor histidine kinase AtoS
MASVEDTCLERPDRIRPRWFSQTVVRYAAIIVVITVIPLAGIILAYDRYASSLLATLSGATLEQRMATMHGRMASFLEARMTQLDTLANYPGLARAVSRLHGSERAPGVRAVLEYEADNPDLYGVLIFSDKGVLIDAIPSQAATGIPYWGGTWEPLQQAAPRLKLARGEVVGPFLPTERQPGSFLLLKPLPTPDGATASALIALHVRLASLTELMGYDAFNGLVQAVLLTPGGAALSPVGHAVALDGQLIEGPALMEGWRVGLELRTPALAQPLTRIREALLAAALATVLLAAGLVGVLAIRADKRIGRLVDGSAALAEGRLDTRIDAGGSDELAVLARAFNQMAERQRDTLSATVEVEKMAVLGRFATGFAHEIRNPLAAIKTTVESLRMTDPEPQRRQLMSGVDEEIDRLDDHLKGFLTYARPAPPAPQPVHSGDVLDRLALLVAHQLQECNIHLAVLGETGLRLCVDPGHLQQILINLVANAIDAMPNGGRLTIRVRRAGERAVLEVSDTGVGIDPALIARMMEPFVTTRPGGSGLGLSISRQLAEINDGTLDLSSLPGVGTTATLVLPRVAAHDRLLTAPPTKGLEIAD